MMIGFDVFSFTFIVVKYRIEKNLAKKNLSKKGFEINGVRNI